MKLDGTEQAPGLSAAVRRGVVGVLLCALLPAALLAVDERKSARAPGRTEARIDPELETLFQEKLAALDSILDAMQEFPDSLVPRELLLQSAQLEREIDDLSVNWRVDELRKGEFLEPSEGPAPGGPPRKRKPRSYNLTRIGEDVEIGVDEVVRGDAIVVAADLWVDGEVLGDAVVLGGDLQLGRESRVRGKAIAIGGRVEKTPGAQVGGRAVGLSFLPRPFFDQLGESWPHWASLLLDVLKLGFLMLLAGLFLVLAPERIARATDYLSTSFLKCFGFGLLALTGGSFAVAVSVMLLVITFIGIPAALLVIFASGVLIVASLFVGVYLIGDRLRVFLRLRAHSPLVSLFLGLFLILLPELLADLLRVAFARPGAGFGLGVLSSALVFLATSSGLGAIVLTKLGARDTTVVARAQG